MDSDTSHDHGPWWLAPGPEQCPHCLRTYHVEAGYRCVACDGPVCAFCAVTVRVRAETYCPDCRPDGSG